ncbi:hypothetical protein F5B20DRAFT_162306 [Whalleya microplaca]|nr:hypothetical protein F5B20DRAFT_162306 [Whalleya microplaca]
MTQSVLCFYPALLPAWFMDRSNAGRRSLSVTRLVRAASFCIQAARRTDSATDIIGGLSEHVNSPISRITQIGNFRRWRLPSHAFNHTHPVLEATRFGLHDANNGDDAEVFLSNTGSPQRILPRRSLLHMQQNISIILFEIALHHSFGLRM